MATTVFNTEEIVLQDEKEVTVKPLPIARLRRFMKAFGKLDELGEDEDGFGVFINCCGIALEKNFEGDFEPMIASAEQQKKGEFLGKKYKEYLEEVLDLETIYKIIEVSGGIKLNDPKMLETMMEMQAKESRGTN